MPSVSNRLRSMFGGGEDPPQTDLELSELYYLLGNPRRRNVIRYVLTEDNPSLSSLTHWIASQEADDGDTIEEGDNAYQSVYISLIQTHLPKLAEADIARRDSSDNIISEDNFDGAVYVLQCFSHISVDGDSVISS